MGLLNPPQSPDVQHRVSCQHPGYPAGVCRGPGALLPPVSPRLVLEGSAGKPSVRKTLLRVLLAEINLSLRRSL